MPASPGDWEAWDRLMPTGECWCGCGGETSIGAFFLTGHDKTAESRVIAECYGNVANFVSAHGYAPNGRFWSRAFKGDGE